MCRLLLCLFLPFLLSAESLRVASYNLHNYLIHHRRVDGEFRPEYPKPESEKAALRDIIKQASPDVLAIQEIGGEDFLKELQDDLRAEGLHYEHSCVLMMEGEPRGLAVLSRYPFEEVVRHTDLDFRWLGEERPKVKRGLLEVHFKVAGQPWLLFNLHLKSRRTIDEADPESRKWRAGEATAIRDYIRELYPPSEGHAICLLGDFNDTASSSTLKRFRQVNGEPLFTELVLRDSRGHSWTHLWRRERLYSQADYLFLSEAMREKLSTQTGTIADYPKCELASDHRLIYADFELGEAPVGIVRGDL